MAMMQYYSHAQRIDFFRSQGKEGVCWDFKQEWHERMEDLIKDIICFANTSHDEDCYIIFGVADDLAITGMSQPRRKQADIIEAISNLHFAGDNYPRIAVDSILYENTTVDVLVIYNNTQTPLYLKKAYGKMREGCIYLRLEDKNTPDNGNADIGDIEMLWKKRLGLTKTPLQIIYDRMHDHTEWAEENSRYYNKFHPEYTIEMVEDEDDPNRDEFYSYAMTNERTTFGELHIMCHNTILKKHPTVSLDSARLLVPCPEWGWVCHDENGRNAQYAYKFYIAGTDLFRVLLFLYNPQNSEQHSAFSQLQDVVLIYDNLEERLAFEVYLEEHKQLVADRIAVTDRFNYIQTESDAKTKEYIKRLHTGVALKSLLAEFRNLRKKEDAHNGH